MPDGDIVELREGDLPNRQPYGIDDDDVISVSASHVLSISL